MKEMNTQHTLNQFFKEFRNLPCSFKIEQVHQLLNNPDAKATHKVNYRLNHLKLIIMTSAFIIGAASIFLWWAPKETKQIVKEPLPIHKENVTPVFNGNDTTSKKTTNLSNGKESNKVKKQQMEDAQPKVIFTSQRTTETSEKNMEKDDCQWPVDTSINKNSLYVYLSNDELEKLGVHIVSENQYYYLTTDGKNQRSRCWNVPCRSDTMDATPFHIERQTDTLCTSERWESDFYNEVDTLVPVFTKGLTYKDNIFWFVPSDTFFSILPSRYEYLKNIYENLKCIKKQNPDKNIVDHWDISRNIVFDKINYLTLNEEELEDIGIIFQKDRILMSDITGTYYYRFDHGGEENGRRKSDTILFPSLFPSLMTDIKGLELARFGQSFSNEKNNKNNYDLLIPVLMPLNEYIAERNYNLVFWYFPTDEFVAALPERIRNDLKYELETINNSRSENPSSCNYFEVCKSTLNLDNFNVFPNPANYSITIEFEALEELKGNISLVNISGVELKMLVSNSSFTSGKNNFQVDISGVTPGIYIISVNTDKGFKTQRLIVSR
ncbi:MAG: T9SS type A sorting domain-containing protein [Bacteroidales bacterium]|nr:T9SS type A sorting domain-containing protein [Bacteroidales bacterium]